MKKWLGVLVSVGVMAGLGASPAAAVDIGFSGLLWGFDGSQTGRLVRDDPASSCAAPQTAALVATGTFNYDTFTFTQGATASCVTVTVTAAATCTGEGDPIHAAAYLGSYDPASQLSNYIADVGATVPAGESKSFSFNLAAGQTVVLVIAETETGAVCEYTGIVSGLSAGATPVTFRSLAAFRTSKGVIVRWNTAAELQMLGFNVYRQVNGRRVRANARLIAARRLGSYSFVDRGAPRAKVVRYWVQVVNLDGTRSWYGPARVARA